MFVARGGLEPPLTGPKPAVLPLDDRAKNVVSTDPKDRDRSKSSQDENAFFSTKHSEQFFGLQYSLN